MIYSMLQIPIKQKYVCSTTHNYYKYVRFATNVVPHKKNISFTLNDPLNKVKFYTNMLKNDFCPKVYSNDMINFFIKHIFHPFREPTIICESVINDYARIDDNFSKNISGDIRSNFNNMKLLKPLLYSQMINPEFYNTLFFPRSYSVNSYSLYQPLHKLHDMITQKRYNYCIRYGNAHIRYYIGNNFLYKKIKTEYTNTKYYNQEMESLYITKRIEIYKNIIAQKNFIEKLDKIDCSKLNLNNYVEFLRLLSNNIETVRIEKKNGRIKEFKKINKIFVPTLEIDLFWHAHMLDPDCYYSDCMTNFGFLLDHDDKISDNELIENREETKKLWDEQIGTPLVYGTGAYILTNDIKSDNSGDKKSDSSAGCGTAGISCSSCSGCSGCGGCGGCG
jgi:hypothetical protein